MSGWIRGFTRRQKQHWRQLQQKGKEEEKQELTTLNPIYNIHISLSPLASEVFPEKSSETSRVHDTSWKTNVRESRAVLE